MGKLPLSWVNVYQLEHLICVKMNKPEESETCEVSQEKKDMDNLMHSQDMKDLDNLLESIEDHDFYCSELFETIMYEHITNLTLRLTMLSGLCGRGERWVLIPIGAVSPSDPLESICIGVPLISR